VDVAAIFFYDEQVATVLNDFFSMKLMVVIECHVYCILLFLH